MNNEVSSGSAHSDQWTVQPEADLSQHLINWIENPCQERIDWPNDPDASEGLVTTPAALPTPPTTNGDDIPAAAEAGSHVRSVTPGDSAGPSDGEAETSNLKRKRDDDEAGSSPDKRQSIADVLTRNKMIDIGSIAEMNLHDNIEAFAQMHDVHHALQAVLAFQHCLIAHHMSGMRYGWSFPMFGPIALLLRELIDWLQVIARGEQCPGVPLSEQSQS